MTTNISDTDNKMSVEKANIHVKPMFLDTIEVYLTILKVDITNCEVTRAREQCTNGWDLSYKENGTRTEIIS